jgi:hypothetical protein
LRAQRAATTLMVQVENAEFVMLSTAGEAEGGEM